MMHINDFQKDCKDFCLTYNRKKDSDSLRRKIFPKAETDDKSSNFGIMYYEIGRSLNVGKERLADFSNFITFLARICHLADDLVDGGPSAEGKMERAGIVLFCYENMGDFLNRLHLNYAIIREGFENGVRLFGQEESLKKAKPNMGAVQRMLKAGSPDINMYNNLFNSLWKKTRLIRFMEHYAVVDLISDHLADLEEDFENKSFNPVLWLLSSERKFDNLESLREYLPKSKGLASILETAEERALAAEETLGNDKLSNLLRFYINGEIDGLKLFRKYNCLTGFPDGQKLKYLILKPHPWEVYSYGEVFKRKPDSGPACLGGQDGRD